jgi:DNA excision repair protein ERCC-4
MSSPTAATSDPATFGVVTIDTREQSPFEFSGFTTDVIAGKLFPLTVTTERGTLKSGDYSIAGHHDAVAIERKSVEDLFGTLGQGRDRFERELARLDAMRYAAVVVEGDWSRIVFGPPTYSKLSPKTVFRSVIAWQQRYRNVHWWMCLDRRFAEAVTLRALMRFKSEHERELKELKAVGN